VIYNFIFPLADDLGFLNIFRYITFRSGGALITAMIISFIFGPYLIKLLKSYQSKGQPIRTDGPEWQIKAKKGTPTMGGVLILLSIFFSTIIWADISNLYIWMVLFVTIGLGFLGFLDDYMKVTKFNHKGLSGKIKILGQVIISFLFSLGLYCISEENIRDVITIPFLKDYIINLGSVWFVFSIIVVVGASNSVNLTDGLDGLAIVPIIIVASVLGLISYLVGNVVFSEYLNIQYISGTGELTVFCAAFVGAGLGFLWFNAPPASIFMGDTGSLAAGGSLGVISVIVRHEFVLAIIGGLFVLEAASVIIQVISFKITGKRVFKMAPIHHHFEQLGWSESKVVIRFWIISIIFALIGLATLKIR